MLKTSRPKLAAQALLFFMAAISAAAHAQTDPGVPGQGRTVVMERDSAAGRVVANEYQGRVAYVRIEAREPGAVLNQHPLQIDAAGVRTLLSRILLQGRAPEPLFSSTELDEICAPVAAALGKATPEQDVTLAVSGRHGAMGPLVPRSVTTARVFRLEGRLQVIAGLIRTNFDSQFLATGYLIAFEPGQRAKVVDTSAKIGVAPEAGSSRRADWVSLNIETAQTPAVAQPVASPPAAPMAAPAPAPAVGTTPPASDAETIYHGISERLKALQKLRDAGLIDQKEYEERKKEILKEL